MLNSKKSVKMKIDSNTTEKYSKFALSCSLRSHHKANPTPKMATPYLALPAHHPEKKREIGAERVKNGIVKYSVELKSKSAWDATAPNERFCVIAAVSPQIMQCKLASYYPAESSVEAATTQSRHHVSSKRWTVRTDNEKWS